jgi:transcriptional regulator with XRE-family HTH domain
MKHTYAMSSIGERLLALRLERDGLEATQVARAIGVTPSALSQWERGSVRNIRPDNLLGAARYFDVSLPWLITGTGPRRAEEAVTDEEIRALALFRRLSEQGQLAMLGQLEWMASREGKIDPLDDAPTRLRHFQ